ncbi:SPOR domain-containing protein [Sphingomonas astaxanthinifaciens]|uniref:SPOR domain-containing protein n=1 Tax=Sphingomonas astaxanthinifaciens TaxID=407019 RepID=UPI00146FAF78|nr:SPOR domain-containing protein [Sphingomonas astaxanthinifaciens]
MIRFSLLLLGGAALIPGAATAQYIGGHAPAPPPAPVAGSFESPEASLARNVRLLAINPKDYNALLGAGRAALRLGDSEAAIGFFGRAEEINAAHWAPKAGQGSALTQMGEGIAALGLFEQAQRLGATQSMIALDRGLAFDIIGRQAEAQSDYRAVLTGPDADEARRRLALSVAISGRKAEALALLDPLLARRDAGARRARAMILALGGDVEGARQAIALMMPGSSTGFDPFLRRLPTLGPGQKAAAVNLGIMPAEGAALAAADPVEASPPPAPVRVASVAPRPVPKRAPDPGPKADRLADIETALVKLPPFATGTAKPPPAPKPIVEKLKAKPKPAAEEPTDLKGKLRLAALEGKNKPAEAKPAANCAKLKGSAKTKCETAALAARDEDDAAVAKACAKLKGAARTSCVAKTAVAAKGDDDAKPAKASVGSRIYVQLAGGSNADQMEKEFARIRARKAALFKGRQPVVSAMKGWSRLLVGPFKDADAAQEFVNDLHAARLEGFVWTAPGGIKFEKLAAK